MVEVVGPVGVEAPTAAVRVGGSPSGSLSPLSAITIAPGHVALARAVELGEEVAGALVVDGVAGVDPQAVDVEVARASPRRSGGPTRAPRPTAGLVVVDRRSPQDVWYLPLKYGPNGA